MNEAEQLPTFTVTRETHVTVKLRCPVCGRVNRHGWPMGTDCGGHRGSHCPCWPRGYYITMESPHREVTAR
ncbi:MAG: hypothetical protein V1924_00880 [Candidatus Bathyarchaeota archaeon]